MHYLRHFATLLLLLILSACNMVGGRKADSQTGKPERTYITAQQNDPDRKIYAWQGNLDGQYPVLMWYREFGDELEGKLFYTEQDHATPIRLTGRKNDTEYILKETAPDGTVTGIWHLKPDAISIEGYWQSPNGKRRYNASLMHIDTAVKIQREVFPDVQMK